MQFQNILALAFFGVAAQAAFDCKCTTDALTISCCNAGGFQNSVKGDGKRMCYVNNIVAPLPASFPFKSCCGSSFELCR